MQGFMCLSSLGMYIFKFIVHCLIPQIPTYSYTVYSYPSANHDYSEPSSPAEHSLPSPPANTPPQAEIEYSYDYILQ